MVSYSYNSECYNPKKHWLLIMGDSKELLVRIYTPWEAGRYPFWCSNWRVIHVECFVRMVIAPNCLVESMCPNPRSPFAYSLPSWLI